MTGNMNDNDDAVKTLVKKWGPILEHKKYAPLRSASQKAVMAVLLENATDLPKTNYTTLGLLGESAPVNVSGNDGFTTAADQAGPVAGYDPIIINMLRRTMPNLIAYDIAGVQPLTSPAGLIFALRGKYNAPSGNTSSEAFYNEADTAFSGSGTHAGGLGGATAIQTGRPMPTGDGEVLGTSGNPWPEMGISLESVTAKVGTRALKASWSVEMDQDLRNQHGLDARQELQNLLAGEILAEINRELIRTVFVTAAVGAAAGTTATPGTFDLDIDANGRWSGEKFKGLMFHVDRESHAIAKATRRGRGNIILCSAEVASALQYAGVLDYTPALNTNTLEVDDTGNTFAGILNNRYRVYVDPYSAGNYLVVGYKGASAWDSGLIYSPYQPLQLHQTIHSETLQPVIGFKTRYALTANPFSGGPVQSDGALVANSNQYYRKVRIENIL